MPLIITIDGPAAAGKSSVAKELSKRLNLIYLDSGALYRAMAWKILEKGIDVEAQQDVEVFCQGLNVEIRLMDKEDEQIWVDSQNVTPFLRRPEVTRASSLLSTYSGVRQKLLSVQRSLAKEGVVAEGRDTGTVVFPKADLKFYLDASLAIRGERRFKEQVDKGIPCDIKTVIDEIEKRDQRDRQRAVAPLYAAADAVLMDSTSLSLEEVVFIMLQEVAKKR